MGRKLTIGELSRRTGTSVKTLRFYSDEDFLPPAARSPSGYRLYTEEHVLRVDLIRSLREAGVGLEDIGKVLRRDLTLEEVLQLRLGTVEAHIVGLQRIAAALRLAIQSGATEEHLRRITMVTQASNEDRRQLIANFYEKVAEGMPVDRSWIDGMIDASAPRLPDSPNAAQLAAWIELQGLLEDPTFLACKRVNAADAWVPRVGVDGFLDAQEIAMTATRIARERGVSPSSDEGAAIVARFASAMAALAHEDPARARAHLRVKYDPRGARYWELVAVTKGEPPVGQFDDWRWLGEALQHHASAA